MKLYPLVACLHLMFIARYIKGSVIKAPLDIISYDDISHDDRKELDYLHQKYGRPKRSGVGSGSGDILGTLKLAIAQGIKNKIGDIAKGSVAASARLSTGSSGSSSGYGYHHSPPPHQGTDYKSLDFWSLKKSILNTLLQAVKAIKGGVVAIKGQLIKGSGYLTAATGKLIVTKGDAVTDLGKKIAASAILVPYNHGHPSSSGHAEYGPPPGAHYTAPSSSGDFYHGAPSAPASEFHEAGHHHPYHDDETPHNGPSGLLILKKIQGDRYHHSAQESKVTPYHHVEPSGPSFGTILGKFLSASSSLDPHSPEPFGNSASGSIHPYHSDSHAAYETSETKNHHQVAPSASGYVVDEEPEHEKPSESDSPFEKEPSYLAHDLDDYVGSSSKRKPQSFSSRPVPQEQSEENSHSNHPGPSSSPSKPSDSSEPIQHFAQNQLVQTLPSTVANGGYGFYNLPNLAEHPTDLSSSSDSLLKLHSSVGELPASVLQNNQQLYYPAQSSPVIDFTKNYKEPEFDNSAENLIPQHVFPNSVPDHYKLPSDSIPSSQDPRYVHTISNSHRPKLTHYDSVPSSSKYKSKNTRNKPHTSSIRKRQPSGMRTSTRHKSKPTYDMVKSIAYQLGPSGPKRLT